MSPKPYHLPTPPKPVPDYLPPDVHPRTTAEEVDVFRSEVPAWYCDGPWIAWRYGPAAHRDGWTKLPLDPQAPGRFARVNDRTTWGSLPQAIDFRRRYNCDGVSRVLVAGDRVTAVDLDGVRDRLTGELSPLAEELLGRVAGHAETSPGGAGIHLYGRYPFPEPGGRHGRKRGQVECYGGQRFMTCTARALRPEAGPPPADAEAAFRSWFRDRLPPPTTAGLPSRPGAALLLADHEVLARALRARNGHVFEALWRGDTSRHDDDHSRADAALARLLWFWSGDAAQVDRLFRRSQLYRAKWDSPRPGGTYGTRTIAYTQGSGGGR